jgi:hypothetical protein
VVYQHFGGLYLRLQVLDVYVEELAWVYSAIRFGFWGRVEIEKLKV